MHDLTHLCIFSGIGGFALAAKAAGFRTVGFSEVEPYACRVLEERFPGIPNIGDVRQRAEFARFRGCTVVTGGFPCQPWSVAGERRGTSDDRHLWPAMCDVLKTVRPAWVIGENVPGIINVGLEQVCVDLENLGYSTQPVVVPACAVGAMHRRDRVWILARIDGERELQPRRRESECGRRAPHGFAAITPDAHGAGFSVAGTEQNGSHRGERGGVLATSLEWSAEPPVVRKLHGIPNRAHRIKALGNSIVPQVAKRFFEFIAAIERGQT